MIENGPHEFSRADLEARLSACRGRTLGEIDAADVFFAVDPWRNPSHSPKIKGVAGDVIERSVMGYPSDSSQRPDLLVDGVEVELKTTALRAGKDDGGWEAKEPMSITAVSIPTIAAQTFESSAFWHKARRMLLVYYEYAAETAVASIEYARFSIIDYQFHEFDAIERETLRQDWQIVHDFIADAQARLAGDALKERYRLIGRETRPHLMLIDTSPKYPNPPRFRLKRATVTVIARKRLGQRMLQTARPYTSFDEVDEELRGICARFQGMSLAQMADEIGYRPSPGKSTAEQVFTRLFGPGGKIGDIEVFAKTGVEVKTAKVLPSGRLDQDVKFKPVDLGFYTDPDARFEESELCTYFSEAQLVFMLFSIPRTQAPIDEQVFMGFKRLSVPEEVIDGEVRRCFESTLDLVAGGKLRFVPELDRQGRPIINRSGTVKGAPNFPKSTDCQVFLKGSGADARARRELLPGVPMLKQYAWWGKRLAKQLLDEAPWV